MLERISVIQGIGLLHDANGKPHTLPKAMLVYGDNGRGKSTLATVLRSLSTGDGSPITNRKTLDGKLAPKVVLQFGSGHKVTFDSGAWSERRPEVLVFDADFVERNVHSGGAVSTNHRKNLLEFALGEHAVSARTAVDKATNVAKKAADEVQALTAQLAGHHTGMTLPQFEKLSPVADAGAQLANLEKQISAARNTAAILTKPVPNAIAVPTFDASGIFGTLRISLQDVHAHAEQAVKQHVAKLGSKAAEGWLSQGRQYGDGKTCPYCDQDITNSDLIKAYQTHFNAAYADLKTKVAALQQGVLSATAANHIDAFSHAVVAAAAQAAAWSEHVLTDPIEFDAESARTALAELQTFLIGLSDLKQVSPAEAVGTEQDVEHANLLWQKTVVHMQATISAINGANNLIAEYKSKLATAKTAELQLQVQQIQATKRRFDASVIALLGKLNTARSTAAEAEKEKKVQRETLDTLMTSTLKQYEASINALLKNFGASFTIKGMGANFRGASPRSEYGLLLRGKEVVLEGGTPSFATALSEGDKRTLAFAFFVASTLADPKLATRIVVVDDPMCSLDLNRRHHTRSILKKLHAEADQLIVLAHDPYFIRDLRDALRKEDPSTPISFLQLVLAPGDYTSFAPFEVDKECESAYFQHHRLLSECVVGASPDARSVAKAIRPMLEGYLHRRFPGLVSKSLMFGQVVVLIRDAAAPNPLFHAQNLVAELNDINEYAGQFHHDTNAGADTITVVASELKTYVERALHIVHTGKALA